MAGRVVDRILQFVASNDGVMDSALARMAKDIKMLSQAKAPYKSGDLQHSGTDRRVGKLKYSVEFDEDYASYQERGMRADGTHVVRQYTTPSTGKHFLAGAGEQIARQAMNYLRQAANNVRMGL